MRQFALTRAVLFLSLATIGGCASAASLQTAPLHSGTSRTYEADYDDAVRVAREAMIEAGMIFESASEVDDRTWMMIGKRPTSGFSWGELVRVVVQRDEENEREVRIFVYSKRRIATNIAAKGDYATSILENIALKLRG